MAVYNSGSVTVKSGSASVKGSSTSFTTYVSAGNLFKITNESTTYTIAAVNSATRLTLSSRYSNTDYESNQTGETIATSDLVATRMFSGTMDYYPIIQSSLIVTASPGNIVFTEDGSGVLTGTPLGDGAIGAIDYDTGVWSLNTGSTLATPITVTASYLSGDTRSSTPYQIVKDFTTNYNIPELSTSDANMAHIFTKAMRTIDSALTYGDFTTIDVSSTLVANTASINSTLAVDTNTLYVDAANNRVGICTISPSQAVDLVGSLKLELTTSPTTGVIYKAANRFMHDFRHPTGDTAIPSGYNTFVGVNAGNFTMGSTATQTYHGSYNTGVGRASLAANTTGYQNTALGYCSLFSNTTGYNNTANGLRALYSNTTGYQNTANGLQALYANTTGYCNTANGSLAGRYIADGSTANQTSDTSVFLGAQTKASADGVSNEIVIGHNAIGQGSNSIMLGNSSTTAIYCYDTTISSPSDERIKKNISSLGQAKMLAFINELRPVTFNKLNPVDWPEAIKPCNFKTRVQKDEKGVDVIVTADARPDDNPDLLAGLIAQEVEAAMAKHGVEYKLVPTGPGGMKAVRYGDLIPALIAAVQELTKRIEKLESK